ncbi:hypothetical protein, partial [Salmonella sp. gx-f7]|uniref:hypothetical protein n=1 Tax=Salmonella sp. gx-f7 TaxID=2582606 RepID=UPI001F1AE056
IIRFKDKIFESGLALYYPENFLHVSKTQTAQKTSMYVTMCSNTNKSGVPGFCSPVSPSEITRVSTAGISSSLAPE